MKAMLCMALLVAGSARANITVYPMSMSLGGIEAGIEGGAGSIQVFSKTQDTQFIKVSVKRVLQPATANEHEETVANWEGAGLVVSPPKFALPAGARRVVRIVGLSRPKNEELYRVYFERASVPEEVTPEAKQPEGSVSVNLIWGVLVQVPPAEPRAELRRAGTGTLHNSGNVRLGLLEVGRCTGRDDASCQWSPLNRSLYPACDLDLAIGAASSEMLRVKYRVEGLADVQSMDLAPTS